MMRRTPSVRAFLHTGFFHPLSPGAPVQGLIRAGLTIDCHSSPVRWQVIFHSADAVSPPLPPRLREGRELLNITQLEILIMLIMKLMLITQTICFLPGTISGPLYLLTHLIQTRRSGLLLSSILASCYGMRGVRQFQVTCLKSLSVYVGSQNLTSGQAPGPGSPTPPLPAAPNRALCLGPGAGLKPHKICGA